MRKKSVGNANDLSKNSRQTVYQRGSQRDGSPHYVFLYSDDEDSESGEDIALERVPIVHHSAPPRKVEVIKISVKPEDTLQALALRYSCTISEIKRINKIHKGNEIFARRYIEVPVRPFSIVTETLIEYEGVSKSVENGQPEPSSSREEKLINLIAHPIVVPPSTGINDIVLNSMCEPLTKLNDVEATRNTGSKDSLLSNVRENSETDKSMIVDFFSCSGADWGLTWAHIVGVALFVGILGPLFIYFFYVAEGTFATP